MLIYCLKCKKDIENVNPRVLKTNNGKIMLLSKCAIYDSKTSKIYKTARSNRHIK